MKQTCGLEIRGVSRIFSRDGKQVLALDKTSFTVEPGRFASIIGPSGCGKSTLFHIIAGLMKPTEGDVLACGESILEKPGTVGYMLQKDLLLPWRTILENVILGMEIQGISRKAAAEQALPLMEKYGLGGFDGHYPSELSGGMRQRAALLRTLLCDREIILLDEPFGALDAQTRFSMQGWLLRLWQDFHKTVLFVTHDIDEAIYLSDEILVFTPRPGTLRERLEVPLARPRTREMLSDPAFCRLKIHLLELLQEGGERLG